ncbi:MAG: hypothetical protein AVDCRST_MAG49-3636 [uncultured Thermomicrobiales bacterium]|uniref:Uncharacterized protein n=1 Tax=uncultured Thermomicrobiales bacterium TaxID=1645740 RepID=A0A6J4VA03_9BACT|nr:MAG: hypothetical protein AVDCRST_MAG49-3636 [uncultured Thermomicrobiales bacterium]
MPSPASRQAPPQATPGALAAGRGVATWWARQESCSWRSRGRTSVSWGIRLAAAPAAVPEPRLPPRREGREANVYSVSIAS